MQPLLGQKELDAAKASRGVFREESRFLKAAQKVAYLEIVLITALLVGIDYAFQPLDGFRDVNPNPYWIPVILIAVQYGVFEGLITALVVSLVGLGCSLGPSFLDDAATLGVGRALDRSLGGDFTTFSNDDYLIAWEHAQQPILWALSALSIGLLRERLRQRNQELARDLKETRAREDVLSEAYEQLLRTKEHLEVRVAGQLRTVFTLYQAAKAIEKLGPGEVLIGIGDLVRAVMQPTKFSLFLLNGNVLEAVLNDGWEEDDPYQRLYDSSSPLFQEVVGRRHFLSAVNADEEKTLGHEGILAGPLTSVDSGEVVGMLKIEKLGFLDLHVSSLENFRILSDWVGTAYSNARRFSKAQSNMLMNDDRTLLTDTAFQQQSKYLKVMGERFGIDVTALHLRAEGVDVLHEDRRQAVIQAIRDVVAQHMSPLVQAFEYRQSGREFALLLPTVNAERDGKAAAAHVEQALAHYIREAGILEVEVSVTPKPVYAVPAPVELGMTGTVGR